MKVPSEVFISAISEKKVYYFSSTKLNTNVPHHYVCIKRSDDDILILTVCTSKLNTIQKFVDSRGLPYETLVWISPADKENPFTTDTYVNCNESFTYTVEEFKNRYDDESISHSGEISEAHYVQILTGLHSSPLIDGETKEAIPKPD